MSTESLAESYFNRFTGDDDNAKALAEIEKLVDSSNPPNGEQENESLDFKQFIREDNELKSRLSRALSGMANVGGGVIVWGVATKPLSRSPEAKKRDTAVNLTPIPDVDLFKDRLVSNYQQATDPPILGVRFAVVYTDSDRKLGFVIQMVPAGEGRPYFSRIDEKYYLRVWDESVVMPRHILQQMFYPTPDVAVRVVLFRNYEPNVSMYAQRVTEEPIYMYRLFIENIGDQSIVEPCVTVTCEGERLFTWDVDAHRRVNLPDFPKLFRLPHTLHPGLSFDVPVVSTVSNNLNRIHFGLYGNNINPRGVLLPDFRTLGSSPPSTPFLLAPDWEPATEEEIRAGRRSSKR